MMKTLAFLLICGVSSGFNALGQTQPPKTKNSTSIVSPVTVQVIEQYMAKVGGKATLQKYFCGDDMTGFAPSYAFSQVATGSKQWVDLVVKLKQYSDAACSLAINGALGAAMQKQPRTVLPYVGITSSLGPEYITLPYLPEEMSDAKALQEVRLTKAALMKVQDNSLIKQRQACLREVDRVEKVILADMTKKK